MEDEPLQRARDRLVAAREGDADPATVDAAVSRAADALTSLAERAAELEAAVPERLGAAVREGMRVEVLPVGRHVAEVRGLANQTIRRLERLQLDLDRERRARVDDLAVLVELVAAGWQAVERRLDRIERSLADRPVAEVYRLDERHERTA